MGDAADAVGVDDDGDGGEGVLEGAATLEVEVSIGVISVVCSVGNRQTTGEEGEEEEGTDVATPDGDDDSYT